MALSHSPQIVTNGLVFYYDMSNPQKSWRGAPTTNLISNPFCLNNTGPSIAFSGYEASATIVPALNDSMRSISPFWIKYVKTSSSNGRVWFLGGGAGSFLTGTDYTYSVYVYTADTNVTGFALGSDNVTVSNTTQVLSSWSTADIGRVKRISAIFRSLNGSNSQGCRITASNPIGTTFYMSAYQCEQQSIATPPVSGTRSNTEAILDLTGNNTVTATSLTYAADGTFSFNGTSDNINLGNTANSQFPHNSPWSIQMSVNIKTFTNTFPGLLVKGGAGGAGVILFFSNTGSLLWKHNNAQGVVCNFSFGQPFILTLTHNGTGLVKVYKDGIYTSNGVSMVSTESASDLVLGRADQFGNSDIYSFVKYSKELSAAEVQQNFNALRGRYEI